MFWGTANAKSLFYGQFGCSYPIPEQVAAHALGPGLLYLVSQMQPFRKQSTNIVKCKKQTNKKPYSVLDNRQGQLNQYKEALKYKGQFTQSIGAGLPTWTCSLLFQWWHSEDLQKVAQNQDSIVGKLSFEQSMRQNTTQLAVKEKTEYDVKWKMSLTAGRTILNCLMLL